MKTQKLLAVLMSLSIFALFGFTAMGAPLVTLAVPSAYPADTATGVDPNPTLCINVTCENCTVYFRSNASGAWVTYQTTVLDAGPYTTERVNWTTTLFYGSETKYWWSYNVSNTTTPGWVNATRSFTTRVVTLGETLAEIISAFIPVIIFMAILGMFFGMIGKIKF